MRRPSIHVDVMHQITCCVKYRTLLALDTEDKYRDEQGPMHPSKEGLSHANWWYHVLLRTVVSMCNTGLQHQPLVTIANTATQNSSQGLIPWDSSSSKVSFEYPQYITRSSISSESHE